METTISYKKDFLSDMRAIYLRKLNKYISIEKELKNELYAQNKPASISQCRYLGRIQKLIMFYQSRYVRSN